MSKHEMEVKESRFTWGAVDGKHALGNFVRLLYASQDQPSRLCTETKLNALFWLSRYFYFKKNGKLPDKDEEFYKSGTLSLEQDYTSNPLYFTFGLKSAIQMILDAGIDITTKVENRDIFKLCLKRKQEGLAYFLYQNAMPPLDAKLMDFYREHKSEYTFLQFFEVAASRGCLNTCMLLIKKTPTTELHAINFEKRLSRIILESPFEKYQEIHFRDVTPRGFKLLKLKALETLKQRGVIAEVKDEIKYDRDGGFLFYWSLMKDTANKLKEAFAGITENFSRAAEPLKTAVKPSAVKKKIGRKFKKLGEKWTDEDGNEVTREEVESQVPQRQILYDSSSDEEVERIYPDARGVFTAASAPPYNPATLSDPLLVQQSVVGKDSQSQ